MEQRLKNRLVGASVIVALVVIFVPEYFEDDGKVVDKPINSGAEVIEDFSSRIVPLGKPDGEATLELQVATELIAESSETQLAEAEEALPGDFSVSSGRWFPRPRQKPSTDVENEAERVGLTVWAVQLASFTEGTNALSLRDRLREQGYAAFVQTVVGAQGSVTRVYVGPELFREQAEAIRKKLISETSLEAMVVKYPGG